MSWTLQGVHEFGLKSLHLGSVVLQKLSYNRCDQRVSIDRSLPRLGDIHVEGQNELFVGKIYLGSNN